MAKRTRRTFTTDEGTRVTAANPIGTMRSNFLNRFLTFRPPVTPILPDDRRTFHPDDPYRAPWASPRFAAQLVVKYGSGSKSKPLRSKQFYQAPPATVGFRRPDRVAFCIKRKTRREVLLALGRGGRNKRGKRNYTSEFSCR